jgi:hypothetical protein
MITTSSLNKRRGVPGPTASILSEDLYEEFRYPGSMRTGRRLLYPAGAIVENSQIAELIAKRNNETARQAIIADRTARRITGPTGSIDPLGETITDSHSEAVGISAAPSVDVGAVPPKPQMTPAAARAAAANAAPRKTIQDKETA